MDILEIIHSRVKVLEKKYYESVDVYGEVNEYTNMLFSEYAGALSVLNDVERYLEQGEDNK